MVDCGRRKQSRLSPHAARLGSPAPRQGRRRAHRVFLQADRGAAHGSGLHPGRARMEAVPSLKGERTMKVTLLVAALCCTVQPASAQVCGPEVKHSIRQVASKSLLETHPPADKALIYLFSPKYEGSLQMMV